VVAKVKQKNIKNKKVKMNLQLAQVVRYCQVVAKVPGRVRE
jgi:hypothetical protein